MLTTTTKRAIIFDDCPMHINYKNDVKRFLDMIPLKASADIIVNEDLKELLYPTFKMIFYLEEHETFYGEQDFIKKVFEYYKSELRFHHIDKLVGKQILNLELVKRDEYFVILANKNENNKFLSYYDALDYMMYYNIGV